MAPTEPYWAFPRAWMLELRRYLFPLAQDYGCNYTTYRVVKFANNDQMLRAVVRGRCVCPPSLREGEGGEDWALAALPTTGVMQTS